MKIVFTLESFFPSHRAGTEIYVLNLCKYFKKQGWEVHVLIATSTEQKDYLYEGIPVHTFDIPKNPDSKELNGIIPPRGLEYFLDRVQEIDPAVVHFHSFGRAINSFHLRAVKALGIRTVFTPHLGSLFCIKGNMRLYEKQNCNGLVDKDRCMQCLLVSRGNSKGFSYISAKGINLFTAVPYLKEQIPSSFYQAKHRKQELQRIGKYSDIIFSIAPWIQNAFIANNITTARLIPQGISEVFFEGTSAESCRDRKDRLNFVFIGRMHPSKGFHLLKEVWDKIDEEKVQLHIITNPSGGKTNYFNSFKKWGEKRDNVIWNEAFSQKMIAEYLQKMDALILPSLSNEVAPLVILEAASKKIPVISSDYIAMKDMVNDKVNGLLFENGNEKDLLTQILKLVYDRELLKSLKKGISTPHCMMEIAAIVEKEIGSCLNDKHLEKTGRVEA